MEGFASIPRRIEFLTSEQGYLEVKIKFGEQVLKF